MEAGFDESDDLTALGVEDIQYLMKFVYKSNVLGRTVSYPFTAWKAY